MFNYGDVLNKGTRTFSRGNNQELMKICRYFKNLLENRLAKKAGNVC